MGVSKPEVVVACNAGEFAELKRRLQWAIALDPLMTPAEELPSDRGGPLSEDLDRVTRAEMLVVLLGDQYGAVAPGSDRSWLELQWAHACREGSKTRVFAFHVSGRAVNADEQPRLAALLGELEREHGVETLDCRATLREWTDSIVSRLSGHMHEQHFDAAAERGEVADFAGQQYIGGAKKRGLDVAGVGSRRPGAVAAHEQWLEARRAIELREWGVAALHLRRALDLRPLDGLASQTLARIHLILGRRTRYGEAIGLAERAASIARADGRRYGAAASYLVAARAAARLGRHGSAERYLDEALGLAPRFARLKLEQARMRCSRGDAAGALDAMEEACALQPAMLRHACEAPGLAAIRGPLQRMVAAQRAEWRRSLTRLLEVEARLARLLGGEAPPIETEELEGAELPRLCSLGRASIQRQYEHVRLAFSRLAHARSSSEDASGPDLEGIERARARVARLSQRWQRAVARRDHQAETLRASDGVSPRVALRWLALSLAVATAASLVSVTLAGVVLLLGLVPPSVRWFVMRRRGAAVREQRVRARQRYERAQARLMVLDAELCTARAQLRDLVHAAEQTARRALELFETRCLTQPAPFQPFHSLRRAEPGDLVRLSPRSVELFEQLYGRRVTLKETVRAFGEAGVLVRAPALYRVIHAGPDHLHLCRERAYLSASLAALASDKRAGVAGLSAPPFAAQTARQTRLAGRWTLADTLA